MVSVTRRYARGHTWVQIPAAGLPALMELFVNIHAYLHVYPMFIMRAVSLFLVYYLSYGMDVNL